MNPARGIGTHHRVPIVVVERKPLRRCPRPHPIQGDIGEAGIGVAAAYIAVHPGEPLLFDGLAGVGQPLPKRRLEVDAFLIDRHGVARVFNDPAQGRIVKRVAAVAAHCLEDPARNAQGAHRIPDAHESDAHLSGVAAPELDRPRRIRPGRPRYILYAVGIKSAWIFFSNPALRMKPARLRAV